MPTLHKSQYHAIHTAHFLSFFLLPALMTIATQATAAEPEPAALVPRPAKVDWQKGYVQLDSTRRSSLPTKPRKARPKCWPRSSVRQPRLRFPVRPMPALAGKLDNAIVLSLDPSLETALGKEGYRLEVLPTPIIRITAAAPAGFFYGGQTLRQLLPAGLRKTKYDAQLMWNFPAAGSKTGRGSPGAACSWTKPGTSSARSSSNTTSTCWPPTS